MGCGLCRAAKQRSGAHCQGPALCAIKEVRPINVDQLPSFKIFLTAIAFPAVQPGGTSHPGMLPLGQKVWRLLSFSTEVLFIHPLTSLTRQLRTT